MRVLKEFRVRLKEQEVKELKEALVKHIERLVKSRNIDWKRYIMLENLHYRLSMLGKRRGGPPAKVYAFFSSKEEMFREMEEWVKYRVMEIEEPEKYEELRKRTLGKLLRC